jgi:hypothetical protein
MSATIELLTYADLLDHLVDFTGANPSPHKYRQSRTAIKEGYSNFRNDFQWPYYYTKGRICTVAPYEEGTVSYDFSGGGVERELILTGGSWPEWAAYGQVLIGAVYYDVADRVSPARLQLDINDAPSADFSDTSYILVRDTYSLPSDYVNMDKLYTPESWQRITYVHPRQWLVAHRYNITSASTPIFFTVRGSPDFMGAMSLSFYPFPDSEQTVDFIYQRRGRPLRIERDTGTANGTLGDTDLNYISGTVFKQDHVGSVVRLSASDDTEYPSGRQGSNPFDEERVIMDVNLAGTQLTVDQQFLNDHSNSRYTISDPVDIEPGTMTGALLRRCEWEMALITRMEDRDMIGKIYHDFLAAHREYASPISHPRVVGDQGVWGRRLAYMPAGEDMG